jgi:hypothetical protein
LTLLAAGSGAVLGWVGGYSVTGCTADSSRVESGAWWHCPTSARVFPPTRGGEAHPPHSEGGQCEELHQHELTHGELPLPHLGSPAAMLSTRAQRRRETVYGWADLPEELVAKVLELLQAAGQEGGFGFSQASATVRLVCAGWKAVYDALVTRLVRTQQTSDEDMGMLVLRWLSLELKGDTWGCVDGRGAASSSEQPPPAPPPCRNALEPLALLRHPPQ